MAILSTFISSGVFLALQYKELSGTATRSSEFEAITELVENHLRYNSILRDALKNGNIDNFLNSLRNNLNSNYLPASGFNSFEIKAITHEQVQDYAGLYKFTVTIVDKKTGREVRLYVLISEL
ncbi:hypothetical protein IX53_06290 [Kosmotoga pacifica]|uniref:Type II secretion system protein n=2 Tax=Kosmotoga pacifica TaxID=1330330 RepID=A0A0G2Z7H0_9BACT|nr:hypothetical protein [Kosmotoga pacifica]AKI97492.1 hypothetical protein IX53_06290 [Kosmotoga pacifica]